MTPPPFRNFSENSSDLLTLPVPKALLFIHQHSNKEELQISSTKKVIPLITDGFAGSPVCCPADNYNCIIFLNPEEVHWNSKRSVSKPWSFLWMVWSNQIFGAHTTKVRGLIRVESSLSKLKSTSWVTDKVAAAAMEHHLDGNVNALKPKSE